MQISKNIFLVSGFAYGVHPNVYAVKGEDAIVLIDTGVDENELKIIDGNLEYWGLAAYPISHVLITHSHFDHSGNAHVMRNRGALIAAGPGDAEGIETGDDRTIGYAYCKEFISCPVDIKLKDGDIIKTGGLEFSVIHVPGHSSGCLFYRIVLEGKTIIFTGDVIGVGIYGDSAILGWTGGVDYNPNIYLETLRKISGLYADVLLCGHFQPCLREGWKIFKKAYMKALMEWRQPMSLNERAKE